MKREPVPDIKAVAVVTSLVWAMSDCHDSSISFESCLKEARKQWAQEVRAKADATPLPQ